MTYTCTLYQESHRGQQPSVTVTCCSESKDPHEYQEAAKAGSESLSFCFHLHLHCQCCSYYHQCLLPQQLTKTERYFVIPQAFLNGIDYGSCAAHNTWSWDVHLSSTSTSCHLSFGISPALGLFSFQNKNNTQLHTNKKTNIQSLIKQN